MPKDHTLIIPLEFASALPNGRARIAVDALGRWIADDTYATGSVMPIESELAETLGVSRATVRDAIKVLSGKGMVRTARRYGTKVMPVDEWNLLDSDVVAWHKPSHPRVRQIFADTTELRAILEPEAAALCALRASDAQIAIIVEAACTMHPETGDIQALFDADCRFHLTILEATTNQVLRQMRHLILTTLRVSYEYGVLNQRNGPVTREGHIAVADAIACRDAIGARNAMTTMLQRNQSIAKHSLVKDK